MSAKLPLLLLFVALCHAFMIPISTENGMYTHSLDENGTDTHTRLDIIPNLASSTKYGAKAILNPDLILPNTVAVCGNGAGQVFNINHQDYVYALEQFLAGCHQSFGLHDYYAVHNSVVIFMCMYRKMPGLCNTQVARMSLDIINAQCGTTNGGFNTGYLLLDSWKKSYGFDGSRNHICR